jgi:hypothetical protein
MSIPIVEEPNAIFERVDSIKETEMPMPLKLQDHYRLTNRRPSRLDFL